MDGIVSLLISIFGKLIAEEVKDWLPAIASCITSRAVGILPEEMRERYSEEWCSHMDDVPGRLAKIFTALGFALAALKVSHPFSKLLSRAVGIGLLVTYSPVFMVVMVISKVYLGGLVFRASSDFISPSGQTITLKGLYSQADKIARRRRVDYLLRVALYKSLPPDLRPRKFNTYPYDFCEFPALLGLLWSSKVDFMLSAFVGMARGDFDWDCLRVIWGELFS